MKNMRQATRAVFFLVAVATGPAGAADYFDAYDLKPNERSIDLAVQPMAYPLAFISSVMRRDRILRDELKKAGRELRTHDFRKGNDIVGHMGGGRIEMAFLGDMPTVNTLVRSPTWIVGLGKRNFSSIIARDHARLDELKGKKVGFSAGSSSHLVLLRGLESARMQERDIVMVPLEPSQMPDALEAETVHAYSAWEPTPSISLARNPKNRAIYRGMSTDWVVFSRDFAEGQPQLALQLVASYVRAIHWMRAAKKNLDRAGGWVLADGKAFTGKMPQLTLQKATEIARKDLLDVPGAPAVPGSIDGLPPLAREFDFLLKQAKIPPDTPPARVREAFNYDGLTQVQRNQRRFRVFEFNYDD